MKKSIATPNFLCIGDPWYQEMASDKRKKLIFESKFPTTFLSSLSIEHIKEEELYQVKICIAPDDKTLSLYEKDRYPQVFNHKELILGCDTACFDIETDSRCINIGTMADGYFGDTHRFTHNRKCQGAIINLFLSDDVFDERTLKEIEYVFEREGK